MNSQSPAGLQTQEQQVSRGLAFGRNPTELGVMALIVAAIAFSFWAALDNLWYRWGSAQE